MNKCVLICGYGISHRGARMLATIASHQGVFLTTDPENDWQLLTEEHLRQLVQRISRHELKRYRGVGDQIADEIENVLSNFGAMLRHGCPCNTRRQRTLIRSESAYEQMRAVE